MTNQTLSVEFPFVANIGDSEAKEVARVFKKLLGPKVPKVGGSFVGIDPREDSWAVFYIGRKPSKAKIQEMLDAAGFVDWMANANV